MKYLNENNWYIKKTNTNITSKKLGILPNIEEYYHDFYVQLPNIRWGKEAMICYPTYQSNERVGSHRF